MNGNRVWGRILAISYSRGRPKSAREMAMRNALRAVRPKTNNSQRTNVPAILPPPSISIAHGKLDAPDDDNGVPSKRSRGNSSDSHRSRSTKSSPGRSRSSSSVSSSSSNESTSSYTSSSSGSGSSCRRSRSSRKRSSSSSSSEHSPSRCRRRRTRHRKSRCKRSSRQKQRGCNTSDNSNRSSKGGSGKSHAINVCSNCISKIKPYFPTSFQSAAITIHHLSLHISTAHYSASDCNINKILLTNMALLPKNSSMSNSINLLCAQSKYEHRDFPAVHLEKKTSRNDRGCVNRLDRFARSDSKNSGNASDAFVVASSLTDEEVLHQAANMLNELLGRLLKEMLKYTVAALPSQQNCSHHIAICLILRSLAIDAQSDRSNGDCPDHRSWAAKVLSRLQRRRNELAWRRRCSYDSVFSVVNRPDQPYQPIPVLLY